MALPQVQLIAAERTDVDYPEADLQGELRLVDGSLLLNQMFGCLACRNELG